MADDRFLEVLAQIKSLAKEYRHITGRPLGCTGEIAEYEAARILELDLSPVRQVGFDARRRCGDREKRIQIKGRCILGGSARNQRIGKINYEQEFDSVMLVLLDEDLNATIIYEADRDAVISALKEPGSRARNERGALSVSKFKTIGRTIWKRLT